MGQPTTLIPLFYHFSELFAHSIPFECHIHIQQVFVETPGKYGCDLKNQKSQNTLNLIKVMLTSASQYTLSLY